MAESSPFVVQRAMKWVHGLGCITCDCYMQGLLCADVLRDFFASAWVVLDVSDV